jgi:TRAP-type mannitol/chloroaromatic compound transport system permease small subunit
MERDLATVVAPDPGRRDPVVLRLWHLLVDGLAVLGTGLIVVLMVLICADVAARNILGGSLPLVTELGAMTVVMIVYLQLASAIRHDRLARTEVFFETIRNRFPRTGLVLGALFDLTAAAMFALIAWSTVGILQRDLSSGNFFGVTGVLTVPTWPFRTLIVLGLAVAATQAALQVFSGLARLPRAGRT